MDDGHGLADQLPETVTNLELALDYYVRAHAGDRADASDLVDAALLAVNAKLREFGVPIDHNQ